MLVICLWNSWSVTEHRRRLELCVVSFWVWCYSRQLQLNPDETTLIMVWLQLKLKQLNTMSLSLCTVVLESVDSVRDLGVSLDSELSMREHKSKISSICFFIFVVNKKLRSLIDSNSVQRLVTAFILSRVDYRQVHLPDYSEC